MCRLRNIAMRDYKETVTTEQTNTYRQTDRPTDRQTLDKVIPMYRYASQATHKVESNAALTHSIFKFTFY